MSAQIPAGIAPIQHSTIPLGRIISTYELGLVFIAGFTETTADEPVQWVHGSDLVDPTPFLTPRTVLLTTGSQFTEEPSRPRANEYVSKLIDVGVCALGFAVGIAHDHIPHTIIEAAETLHLPLFRVPYETPFIAISQTAARLIDAESHARDQWSLDAQRAISSAALQRRGLDAAVRELSARLGRWIAVTDPRGRLVSVSPPAARSIAGSTWVRERAAALVSRGIRSSLVDGRNEDVVEFQTLGHGNRLRGTLLVAGGALLDHAEQTAVALLATIATVHLDQSSALSDSDADLRGALLRMLVAGHIEDARMIAGNAVPDLPNEPLRVIDLGRIDEIKRSRLEDIRGFSTGLDGSLLGAYDDALVMLIEARHMSEASRFLEAAEHTAGLSMRSTFAGLGLAIDQARRAREIALAEGSRGATEYQPAMNLGMLELLEHSPDAHARAAGLCEPLVSHDERHGEQLVESVREWLAHHGQTSPAAAALGIHRQTLRSRIDTAARILERDLDDPDTRADLWAALRVLR